MEQKNQPNFSVVIPAYNEASREDQMRDHLVSIQEYFEKKGMNYEMIVVLDGPTDETPGLVKKHTKDIKNVRIIDRKKNKGKGYSVREGLLAAEGKFRLFTDMDGATPITMLDRFFPKFEEGSDIVIGSRDLEESDVKVHQPKWKELMGDAGNLLIQFVGGLYGTKDTQCGFKAFTQEAVKDIIPRTTVQRWGLDFEILILGKKLGYDIKQVPVEWIDSGDSTVGISGYISTFKDLFKVRWNLMKGVYQLNRKAENIEKTVEDK
ncbi:MAG: dolichyl-phosphate beta-glucosyltransferase [Candidatus Moranbacteria bacterium]|nr:dolichyl-phosphate beta-glucosyltransferase [Candidatus Moranbacteria bacterium]